MKKILKLSLIIIISLFLSGCSKEEVDEFIEKTATMEKYEKINVGMSKEEVDNILTVSNETTNSYEDGKISISYYGKDNTVLTVSIQLSYNNKEVINKKTNLKNVNEYIDKVNKNETVLYDELIASFKTEGYCTRKSVDGCKSYAWADQEKRYVSVSIGNDNEVISIFGKA